MFLREAFPPATIETIMMVIARFPATPQPAEDSSGWVLPGISHCL